MPSLITLLVCAVFLFAPAFAAAAQEAGLILNAAPGAFIARAGTEKPAAAKDSVQKNDTLRTDASGRMRILLADDSSLDLGPDTTFTLEEYVFAGSAKPALQGRLGEGFLRMITGRVVEKNPEGFKISTPEGVIGVRGTIFSVRRSGGSTTLFVENTTRGGVYLQDSLVPTGHKGVLFPGRSPLVSPMNREDRDAISNAFSTAGRRPGGPGPQLAGAPGVFGTGAGLNAGGSDLMRTAATDLLASNMLSDPAPAPTSASYAGSFSGDAISSSYMSGQFGFDVNLTTGAASNAFITGTYSGAPINMTGGSGGMYGPGLFISDFTGTVATYNGAQMKSANFTPGMPQAYFNISLTYNGEADTYGNGQGTAVKK